VRCKRRISRPIAPIRMLLLLAAVWGLLSAAAGIARAQGVAKDQSGTLTAGASDETKNWFVRHFAGTYAEIATYIGSGSFYTSGYRNPYVSNALYLRPSFQLGTKYGLSLNARAYLEEEYTQPDNPQARRFYPLDTWVYLAAKNIYTHPGTKIRFSGALRVVVPTSYESRYAHLVTGVGLGGAANRAFELGKPDSQGKRWGLNVSLGSVFTKYYRSSDLRGTGAGDTSGCRIPAGAPPASSHTGPDGQPTASDTDRCGGPHNSNFAIMTSASAVLNRHRWSLTGTLIVINEVHYSTPADQFVDPNAVTTGRADWTWAILGVGYDVTDHFGVSAGVSSYQPALNSRNGNIRFPFFDFQGPNAYNYTQVFVSLNGTI